MEAAVPATLPDDPTAATPCGDPAVRTARGRRGKRKYELRYRPRDVVTAEQAERARAMEDATEVAVGALIDRLDRAYTDGPLGELFGRDHPDPEVRARGLEQFQELQATLFPVQFVGDAATRAALEGYALVPRRGPGRVGERRWLAFCAVLRGGDLKDVRAKYLAACESP